MPAGVTDRGRLSGGNHARRIARGALSLAWFAIVVGAATQGWALDPTRTLTQSFQRIWQIPQGLPQTTINVLWQTRDGYMWLGTPIGLTRFDGVRFTTMQDCAGVPPAKLWVHDLCEDHDGRLWIATDGMGLLRIRGGQPARYTTAQGLPSDTVQCVMVDREGHVWVGTAAGLARVSPDGTRCEVVPGLGGSGVYAITQTTNNDLWVAGEGNQISQFNGTGWTTHQLASLSSRGHVRALQGTRDDTLWIGTTAGLIRWKEGEQSLVTNFDALANTSILCLAEGRSGGLWVGTKAGFSRLHDGDWESFDTDDGLSQSSVRTMYEDHEGSLWVGTKHGLNQFSDRRSIPVSVREGLPSNNVGPLCQDEAGSIWVGTLDAGLARSVGRRFTTLTTKDGLVSNQILSLARGPLGEIWIGTRSGLNLLREGNVAATFTTADGLPSNVITSLAHVDGGSLWVGTSSGVAEMSGGRFLQPGGDPESVRAPVRALLARRDGTLLVAAEGALYQCRDRQLSRIVNESLADREINALIEDGEGHVWLATESDGMLLLNGSAVENFTTKDGLYDDDIAGLLLDDEDRLWMASSSGISYVPRKDFLNYTAKGSPVLTSSPFRLTDSTRSYEAQEGAQPVICRAGDGRIWFSTTRGLIVIDPKKLVRDLPPTSVVVEDVVVNGRGREINEISQLPPGSSNLSFSYTALSLITPMRTMFRYKLEGFNSDWVNAGARREAFYTNLSPGQYRFRVEARIADNPYWEASPPLTFTIEPRFYQTRWFLPLCVLALGLTGLGIYRLRVRRIKAQMRLVVGERSRIARELHDTLMQGFSGVTMEMQALAARLPPSHDRVVLDDIIRDASSCMREARRSVAGLRHEPGDESGLVAALGQAARRMTEVGDIRLRLDLKRNTHGLPVEVEYNLLRIAQEAIANAVKHSAARTIEVILDGTPQELLLSVSDDGSGFVVPAAIGAHPGHYGLIGMKERATQVGADLQIESEPGQGTAVIVRLVLARMAPIATAPARHGALPEV